MPDYETWKTKVGELGQFMLFVLVLLLTVGGGGVIILILLVARLHCWRTGDWSSFGR